MKKLLFFLLGLLVVIFAIPVQRGTAETPDPTPVPDALVAQALAAKQAGYPAWVGDEVGFMEKEYGTSNEFITPKAPESMDSATLLVYQNFVAGNWEIYKFLGLDYSIYPELVSNNPASDIYPRLNRGATRIVFATNRDGNYEIYTMNTDGGELMRLTVNGAIDSQPQWSADGNKIVFVSDRDGNPEIYSMNLDGSNQTRLTSDPASDIFPTISPDGSQIAWLHATSYGAVVWVMNSDGSNQHPISPWNGYAQHLVWSPDGAWLAWDADFTGDGWNEIIIIRPDGTDLTKLAWSGGYLHDVWFSSWTPSQKFISTFVTYVVIDGNLYINDTHPGFLSLDGNAESFGNPMGPDMNHSAESTDIVPPVSSIQPLPLYSRAAGFWVNWAAQSDFDESTGLQLVTVQTRSGLSGNWETWKFSGYPSGPHTVFESELYTTGSPGETIYFRSQAVDGADNYESWPLGNGDTFTTLFSTILTGKITDGRGIRLPLLPVELNPSANNLVTTNLFGRFTAWLKTYANQSVSTQDVAYGEFPASVISGQYDEDLNVYLPSQDDLIENGGFEAEGEPIPAWEFTGTISHTLVMTGHSGTKNVNLGYPCGIPCVTPPTAIDANFDGSFPLLLAGEDETIHLLDNELHYYQWIPDVGWTNDYQISGTTTCGCEELIGMVLDPTGNLYVTWEDYPNIYYIERTTNGQWSTPMVVAQGGDPHITSDSQGNIFIVYSSYHGLLDNEGVYYIKRTQAGTWNEPVYVYEINSVINPKILVDDANTIHIFFTDDPNYIGTMWYITIEGDGTKNVTYLGTANRVFRVLLDDHEQIHLVWNKGEAPYGIGYMVRDSAGNWSVPETPPISFWYSMRIASDQNGGIHLVGRGETGAYYLYRDPEKGWSHPMDVGYMAGYSEIGLAIDTDNLLHFVWRGSDENTYLVLNHSMTAIASQFGNASLSQTISIPSDLHKPTLSFMYQLLGDLDWTDSGYTLSVTSGPTTTQVLSSTTAETWTLGWADMSVWAGQTITLTFTLHQAADEPYVRFLLDDISLGSWLTPVPLAVDATHLILPNSPTQITITGENFLQGATIRLNDIPLQNVQWLDEHTLQATIPAGLEPGRYHLWVTNPGGQASVLANAILAGTEIFLPQVTR